MSRIYSDTGIWNEDWYVSMPGDYQHFQKFSWEHCDCAGVWKPNIITFGKLSGFDISIEKFKEYVNNDKERVIVLKNGRWFFTGYIKFQWFYKKESFWLILSNQLHKSIYDILIANGVDLKLVIGCNGIKENDESDFGENSIQIKLAELLFSLIQRRKPTFKKPDMQKSASTIDKMIRKDKRNPETINKVILWCQNDSGDYEKGGKWKGWQNNILSTEKLRIQFDKLEIAMNEDAFRTKTIKPTKFDKLETDKNGDTWKVIYHIEHGKDVIDKRELYCKAKKGETK